MTLLTSLRRRRPAVLAAGAAGSLALALSTNGTLSAFTAQIQNSTNTAATGYLAMQETLLDSSGAATSTVCTSNDGTSASVATNSATCGTINKYGGTTTRLTPAPNGATNVTKVQIKNTGTVAATAFTLAPGTCSQTPISGIPNGGATDVCSMIDITIDSGGKTIYQGTAAAFSQVDVLAKLGTSSVGPGSAVSFTITAALDSKAGNAYSGFQVSQALTWNFTA